MTIDPVERGRLDPDDLDQRMALAIRLAEGEGGEPFDLCLGELTDGFEWVTEQDVHALCTAAARDAREELLSWLRRKDGALARRLEDVLAAHGFTGPFHTGDRA